jgi:hypothetical protein
MKKYNVVVYKEIIQEVTYEVEAESKEEARKKYIEAPWQYEEVETEFLDTRNKEITDVYESPDN